MYICVLHGNITLVTTLVVTFHPSIEEDICMDERIITFNVANWVTVVLMAAIGFMALGFAQKLVAKKVASNG